MIRNPLQQILRSFLLAVVFMAIAAKGNAEPPKIDRIFPKQAEVNTPGEGLVRLSLPPEVITVIQPDYSDLRIIDAKGEEVPYLLDAPQGPDVGIESTVVVEAKILFASRNEIKEGEFAQRIYTETYVLSAPEAASPSGRWELVIKTARNRYFRSAEVTTEMTPIDRALTEVGSVDTSASIFRMDSDTKNDRIVLPVERFEGVTITIQGEEGFFLEPSFHYESIRHFSQLPREEVPLNEIQHRQNDGVTIIELERPAGIVPDHLQISTNTNSFDRRVEVWSLVQGNRAVRLGQGNVFRVGATRPISELEVALDQSRIRSAGQRIQVEIRNGDSPELEEIQISAIIRRPTLIFALPENQRSATLRFGGGRAHLAQYDIASLLGKRTAQVRGTRAEIATRLYDADQTQVATLGEIRDNPSFNVDPALEFLMAGGAKEDLRYFSHQRTIHITPSKEGLSDFYLASEDLSVMQRNYADLRIIDQGGNQWPYLLVHDARHDEIPAQVELLKKSGSSDRSSYELRFDHAPVWIDQIALSSSSKYFHRNYRLFTLGNDDEEIQLAKGTLLKSSPDSNAASGPVHIGFPAIRVKKLVLEVENGNEEALSFHEVRGRVPVPRVFAVAPEGEYRVLLGNPDADTPRYDIQQAKDIILAVESNSIDVGQLRENEEFSLFALMISGGESSDPLLKVGLWTLMIAVLIFLTAITVRIVREEPGPSQSATRNADPGSEN